MTEFVAAAVAFPTVLFSLLMLVVLAYWLTVALVGIDFDAPVLPISISMFVLVTWFAALVGTVLTPEGKLRYAVLAGALLAGALLTKILSIPLRNWTRPEKPASRNDFVGHSGSGLMISGDGGGNLITDNNAYDNSSSGISLQYQAGGGGDRIAGNRSFCNNGNAWNNLKRSFGRSPTSHNGWRNRSPPSCRKPNNSPMRFAILLIVIVCER